jgi:hypothetical protein
VYAETAGLVPAPIAASANIKSPGSKLGKYPPLLPATDTTK